MSRIVVDITSNKILQVEKTPDVGDFREFGGRYLVPVPDGASFNIDSSSYILPQDGGDVASQLAAALLARFPMYSNIAYNFLLESSDIDDFDLVLSPTVSPVGGYPPLTRVQTGRGASLPGPAGQVPTTTALLPANATTSALRPGMLITDTIDIGPLTSGAGADEFLVWWQIYERNTTHDVASDFGIFAGANDPASRLIAETDQEPATFSVFISHDDGVTWTSVGRLEPTDLVVFDTSVRLAFVNTSTTSKVYLGAYAVMF